MSLLDVYSDLVMKITHGKHNSSARTFGKEYLDSSGVTDLEFYLAVFLSIYNDVVDNHASICSRECARDVETIVNRFESEGVSFLTKTLPRLGKCLDKALSQGEPLQCPSFAKKKDTQLPAFLGWLFSEVFDATGTERSDASVMAVKQLRQILFVFYKLEIPYARERTEAVLRSFVETDESLDWKVEDLRGIDLEVARNARTLVCRVMSKLCPRTIVPRHGKGSVATGEKPTAKRCFQRIVDSIERFYPFTEYFHYNLSHTSDRVNELQGLEEKSGGQARIVLVPKDSRGPRIISCEPLENQWLQQGQMRAICPHLETDPLTRGYVNFTDQTVNGDLALEGSVTGHRCSLDMTEASDRVPWELVKYLFPPLWVEALGATRSTTTMLPCGKVITLKKFAPMGSAVCFPIEALIFWALCTSVVCCTRPEAKLQPEIYVYGDDIICLSEDQAQIRRILPSFGLVLNKDKCCTAGSFRESCGTDAYRGSVVTPVKIHSVWYQSLDVDNYASYVEYSNAFYERGFYRTAQFIEERVQYIRSTPYTETPPSKIDKDSIRLWTADEAENEEYSPKPISFYRPCEAARSLNKRWGIRSRFHPTLHVYQVQGWISLPCVVDVNVDGDDPENGVYTDAHGWEEMLRVVTAGRQIPIFTLDEGGEIPPLSLPPTNATRAGIYALPRRNRLKRGWITL